jgi:hypothetical protein
MMGRHSALRATGVVSIFGSAGPALDEIGLSAWIAQAEPGETLACAAWCCTTRIFVLRQAGSMPS